MKTVLFSLFIFFLAFGAQAAKFEQGYYYDINGQKVEGLINRNPGGKGPIKDEGFITFKEDEKAQKQNLSASMIHGFVIGVDSFTVARAPRNGDWSKNELDFVRVLVDGSLKLYAVSAGGGGGSGFSPGISTGIGVGGGLASGVGLSLGSNLFGGGSHPVYYYGAGPASITQLKKDNFIDVMSEVLGDEPEAVEKVKNKTYKMGDMDKLIAYYNQLRQDNLKK